MKSNYRIECQPELVEEAIHRAIAGCPEETSFRKERDRLYECGDSDDREAAFQHFNQSWLSRLGLDKPLHKVLALWPILTESTSRCVLIKARSKKNVGAELYVTPHDPGLNERERRTIAIQLTPELLTHPPQLLTFLMHELLHLVDMIDPDFGYEPRFPVTDAGPAYDNFLQARYSVLWDVIIEGRLYQRGWLPQAARERQLVVFKRMFAGSEEKVERAFSYFFDHDSHTHRELVEFAQQPHHGLVGSTPNESAKGRCALCHFPTFDLLKTDEIHRAISAKIVEHHPEWNSSQSICRQCADLYEARSR